MSDKNKLKNNGTSLAGAAGAIAENAIGSVQGIISALPMAKYTSGARVVLKINGKLVGFAFGVSWNISTAVSEIRVIDDYLPHELAPQQISVTGTLSMLHIPGTSVGTLNHQANVLNFLKQKYITIEVRDSQSDNILFFTNKAMVTGRQESIQAEQLGQMTLEWRAIGWKDEREPNMPVDFDFLSNPFG